MDLLHLGRHCAVKDCHQLDFLPFHCECGLVLCREHRSPADHQCTAVAERDNRVPSCPMCAKPVPKGRFASVDAAMDAHISSGCKTGSRNKSGVSRCSQKGCKTRTFCEIRCQRCRGNFCVAHRASHTCVPVEHPLVSRMTAIAAQ